MVRKSSPAEAFALLDSPTRIEILEALADSEMVAFRETPVSFSELYDRVDVPDSGQLNYHLARLVGKFVEKTECGYRLGHAGRKVVWSIRSGTFTEEERRTLPANGTCYECGQMALEARVSHGWLHVRCSACGTLHTGNPFPPSGLRNRSPEAVLEAFERVVCHRIDLATDGVCVECTGPMSASVERAIPDEWGHDAVVVAQCANCGYWVTTTFGMVAFRETDVRRRIRGHGSDASDRPYWDFPVCVSDRHTRIESADPYRVTVSVPVGDQRVEVTFDEGLDRRPVEGGPGQT